MCPTSRSNSSLDRPVRSTMRLRLRGSHVPNRAVHVVVEGEQVDAALSEPLADLGFGVEIVGLVAQVKAGVGGELRALPFDRLHQAARIAGAAQARLPRTGRGVKNRGDAVADRLAVAVGERDVDREIDPGARHHLSLEGIAMQIDDARQDQQIARLDRQPRPAARGIDLRDVRSGHEKRRFGELGADQARPPSRNMSVTRPRFVCWQKRVPLLRMP